MALTKRRVVIFVLAGVVAWLLWETVISFYIDDWAALGVKSLRGPVSIRVVNGTAQPIPWLEVGTGGYFCHHHRLDPHESMSCEPVFRSASPVFLALPEDPPHTRRALPITVSWQSYGEVELVVADGGVLVDGGFQNAF